MITFPIVRAAQSRDGSLAKAKLDWPHGHDAVRFAGARGTPDNQALGGLRNPLPSKDGNSGWAEKAKRTVWTVVWNSDVVTCTATAANPGRPDSTIGQSGILAQPCCGQGAPSSICITGEETDETAA